VVPKLMTLNDLERRNGRYFEFDASSLCDNWASFPNTFRLLRTPQLKSAKWLCISWLMMPVNCWQTDKNYICSLHFSFCTDRPTDSAKNTTYFVWQTRHKCHRTSPTSSEAGSRAWA